MKKMYMSTVMKMDGVADSQGDCFPPDAKVVLPSDKVPVTLEFQKGVKDHLGYAEVYKHDNEIRANIFFHIDAKHFKHEIIEGLTPVVGGSVLKREGSIVKSFSIDAIGLTHTPADVRLKTLGGSKNG